MALGKFIVGMKRDTYSGVFHGWVWRLMVAGQVIAESPDFFETSAEAVEAVKLVKSSITRYCKTEVKDEKDTI